MNIKKYKVIFIGDSGVGKTSLIRSYLYGSDLRNVKNTIGAEFSTYRKDNIQLDLWDTAGQERFRSMVKSYCKDVSICMIVSDISNDNSMDNIGDYWIPYLLRTINQKKLPIFYFIFNKKDLIEGEEKTKELNKKIEILVDKYKSILEKNKLIVKREIKDYNENEVLIIKDITTSLDTKLLSEIFNNLFELCKKINIPFNEYKIDLRKNENKNIICRYCGIF